MAQPALDFFRKRNFMLAPQPNVDVAPVFNPAQDGLKLYEGSITTEFDKVERQEDRAYLGNYEFDVANKRAKIEGDFDLYPPLTPGGVATSDADCGRILLASGMTSVKDAVAKTTRYNPLSANMPMFALRGNHTGMRTELLNARCALSGVAIEIGQRAKGKASFLGDYDEVIEENPPLVAVPKKKPVVASKRNTTCLVSTLVRGGTKSTDAAPLVDLHTWSKSLSVDFGNDLGHVEYTEYGTNRIKDRKPTFAWKVAKTDITNDFNPWFVRDNGILVTLAFALYENNVVGGVLSGLYTLLYVRGQIENITPTEIDGDHGWDITGNCVPSDAGNDELYIEFGDDAGP